MPVKKTPGSITHTADAMDDRINNISSVSKTINGMQRDVDQKISETREEVIKGSEVDAIHSSMNQTLGQLNNTIGALSSGIKTITVDTAKATKDAISSYGRAISEDISFNKKSVVAMALAKTSPLYGYFVAKFVESDVWKKAMSRMAQSVSRTMGAIVRPFKGRPAMEKGIPQLKNGGYIQQGGMANLHAGETVTPAGGGAGLNQLVELQQKQLIYLRSVFGVVRYKEPGMWGRFVNTMGAPLRFVNRFRKTQGVYTSGLSSSKQPLVNIAQNIATLYSSLMWRLDNMTNIMIANAIANRDLTMHTIGKGYPAIKGVRTRQLVRPRARKLLRMGMKAMPYAAGLLGAGMGGLGGAGLLAAGIGGRMLTRKAKDVAREEEETGKRKGLGVLGFLGRQRGMYRGIEEEGFVSGKLRRLRESWLPRRGELVARKGGMQGTGIGAATRMTLMNTPPGHLAQMIGIGVRNALSGRKGRRKPVWMIRIPSSEQKRAWKEIKTQDRKQTKTLKLIKDNTKESSNTLGDFFKRFKKWVFISRLLKGLSFGLGFIKDIVAGIFKTVFSSSMVVAAIAAAVAAKLGMDKVENHLKNIADYTKKLQDQTKKEQDKAVDYIEKVKKGEMHPEVAFHQMQKAKRLQLGASAKSVLSKKLTGPVGDLALTDIQAGMRTYVRSQPGYLNYDANEINALRAEWIQSGEGFRFFQLADAAAIMGSPQTWGEEFEAKFYKHMTNKLVPISGEKRTAGKNYYTAYEAGLAERAKRGEDISAIRKQNLDALKRMHIGSKFDVKGQKQLAENAAIRVLTTEYGLSPGEAKERLRFYISALQDRQDILTSPEALGRIARQAMIAERSATGSLTMDMYGEASVDPGTLYEQHARAAASKMGAQDHLTPGAISPDAIAQNKMAIEAEKNTAGVKSNTDAIEHNTMALKQEGEQSRKSNINVSNQQTTAISNVLQSSHSSSSGGGGGGSDYWADVNLKMGQGH